MKSNNETKYSWGYILADCILLLNAIVDVLSGKTTLQEILVLLVISVLSACLLFSWIKKRTEKRKK